MPDPFYRATGNEIEVFSYAFREELPLLLKGPTGCGKSRFVEAMAHRLDRPLITQVCHDDTSSADLLGRYLIKGGDTVWQDGPVTRALRKGAILYLDEIAEAREDVIVVLHALTDHRRTLFLDRTSEEIRATKDFMLVVSYNPGYQRSLKELKPATRQRFLGLQFSYPTRSTEMEILMGETGVESPMAGKLAGLAEKIRSLKDLSLVETVSTRLLVNAAKLIKAGMPVRDACLTAIVEPLSDEPEIVQSLTDLVHFTV